MADKAQNQRLIQQPHGDSIVLPFEFPDSDVIVEVDDLLHSELSQNNHRASTLASHYLSVERVIRVIKDDLSRPFSLKGMASIASVSPYHFNRIFRAITGTPPLRFLYALRIARAKKLILQTDYNITSTCFEVGYNSLGTFSTRFKEFVGIAPSKLRHLVKSAAVPYPESFPHHPANSFEPIVIDAALTGKVSTDEILAGPIFIGLFDSPIPQGNPVGCTILTMPGTYRIATVPNGEYYIFALSLRWSDEPLSYALLHEEQIRVGTGHTSVVIDEHHPTAKVDVQLRPIRSIDPPILVDLLSLLVKGGFFNAPDW